MSRYARQAKPATGDRTCTRCKTRKPLQAFDKMHRAKGGRRSTCRQCRDEARGDRTPEIPRFHRPLEAKRYIITAAQNATDIHEEFWSALKVAAEHMGAELVVIPLRYKNPTSVWSQNNKRDDWWGINPLREARGEANPITDYLYNQRKKLNDNLVLVADVKIQPTAQSPLSGFESLTGAESCIIGHPKLQFKTVPTPSGRFPKILTTTGVITKKNYTDSKAGALGAFHHHLGALVVEISGKHFHMRQLNADRVDGSFIDLDRHYSSSGVTQAPPALALVCGDMHARFTSKAVDRATFGPGGIVETINAQTVVFHDLFDGYSVNHHHAGNPFIAAAKARAKLGDVRAEVEHAIDFVKERCKGRKAVIVGSNHDDFLARWVRAADWRHMGPANAEFYLETARAILASAQMTESGADYSDPFVHWVDKLKGKADIRALRRHEGFKLGGVELSLHGHQGPNGAKGTAKNLARLGVKTVSGHSHTPGIEEGGYTVGTSTPLALEYCNGPGSWLNTHCPIYANGKRALITIIGDEWCIPLAPLQSQRKAS